MAVGFGIKRDNIPRFIRAINDYAAAHPAPAPTLELDCKLNPAQLSVSMAESLSMLEPCGAENPTPMFGLYNMTLRDIRELGGGKHLKLTLARGDCTVSAMRFSTTLKDFPYMVGDVVNLAVTLDVNLYNNNKNLSVIIRDMRFSGFDDDGYISSKEIFESFCRGDSITADQAASITPDRDEFAVVYRYLRANGGYHWSLDTLLYRIGSDFSYGKLRVILECMNELELIRIFEGIYACEIKMCQVEGKVNLNDSLIIQKLREVCENE
jgi:single-stranded-DNA-specific exonuclease